MGDPNYCGRRAYNFRKSAHADATEKVSVIIPAFSEKKSVKSNIELLTDQDYQSHEVILVDDGSPDGTLEIARRYEGMTLKVVHQENGGKA